MKVYKKEARALLKEKYGYYFGNLKYEEQALVLSIIANQQEGFSPQVEVCKMKCFMNNWITVDEAVGYIIRNM